MTATTAIAAGGRHQRPLLPLASLVLAGAALTVSLIALTTNDEPANSNVVTAQDQTAPAQAPAAARRTATPPAIASPGRSSSAAEPTSDARSLRFVSPRTSPTTYPVT